MIARREAGDLASELLFSRQVAAQKSFLLVEGIDDQRFFKPRLAQAACELVMSGDKASAVGAIRLLDNQAFRGAVAIVDDDCDSLEGRSTGSANLIATDAHDLECLLLRSPALDSVLSEYAAADALRRLQDQGQGVREMLLERGLLFGRLRWLNARHDWRVNFERLSPYRFVARETWEVRHADLRAEFQAAGCPLTEVELAGALAALRGGDPWRICQGHDLVAILVIGLQGVLGSGHNNNLRSEQVAAVLRQAIRPLDFAATELCRELHAWERRNPPFTVLAA